MIKNTNFRGDLSDVSATTATRIPSSENADDLFTKALYNPALEMLREFLGMQTLELKSGTVVIFGPKYQSTHPENYLFSLSKKIFSGSKYPKNSFFNFEKRSTGLEADHKCCILPVCERRSILKLLIVFCLSSMFFFLLLDFFSVSPQVRRAWGVLAHILSNL